MPILKATDKLIFYAHVPKCGGSAVEQYMHDRFGLVAFQNTVFGQRPEAKRWSKTSPQHIDIESLDLLFPKGFFDASFAIVRHPVSRIVSAYHFQLEVERIIPTHVSFGEWLEDIPDILAERPFAHDNHIRPMTELVPADAKIFYLEHGLDALVPWFDDITGVAAEPRAVPHVNKRNEYSKSKTERVKPTPAEIERIAKFYAADFERFAYVPDQKAPQVPAPVLSEDILRQRDMALETQTKFSWKRLTGQMRGLLR